MPIKVTCECGQKLIARDSLAGQQKNCPHCRASIVIPTLEAGQTAQTSVRPSKSSLCPECQQPLPSNLVVCLECGFNRRLGRKMVTTVVLSPEKQLSKRLWGRIVPACGATVVLASLLQTFLNGPEFLILFGFLGLLGVVTLGVARKNEWGITLVFLVVFLSYESIGLVRLWYGSSAGMEHFGLLYWMMALGPLALFLGASEVHYSRSDTIFGCGGGCGCGGCGCGGCGG
ncbi:MAG: hypothetical protein MK102_16875 [Fuerstiella sp.]|nr:hypothetical protein [Fuerstiella sp.]